MLFPGGTHRFLHKWTCISYTMHGVTKPMCIHEFIIPDTDIKSLTMITDVTKPLMLAVIYRYSITALASGERVRNSSALSPLCVDGVVKAT